MGRVVIVRVIALSSSQGFLRQAQRGGKRFAREGQDPALSEAIAIGLLLFAGARVYVARLIRRGSALSNTTGPRLNCPIPPHVEESTDG
jgi:hypothetical protein